MRDDAISEAGTAAAPPRPGAANGERTHGFVERESPRTGCGRIGPPETSPDTGAWRKKLRREALEAATALFAEHHVARADVDALLNHTGARQRTAGPIFSSKEVLFTAVLERERSKLIAALVSPLARGDVTADARTLTDACTMIVGHVFDYHRSRPHSLRLVFGSANRGLTGSIRREVQCLVRLAVEQCLERHLQYDDRASSRALSVAVTTSALALSDLVTDGRHEAGCAVLSALGVHGAHSAA